MKLEKWAAVAEIVGSAAVLATLVVLILEIRSNTAAIERQSAQERSTRIADPYLYSDRFPAIYAKIKEKDFGTEAAVQAFVEQYDLDVEESVLWVRHLELIWGGLQSDYSYSGPSESLENEILDLMSYPDEQLYWEHTADYWMPNFVSYVNDLVERQ